MPDQIGELKAAGFSDDEIGAWSGQQRQQLSAAGFSDDEINQYLGGGVRVPDQPPKAWLDRLSLGTALGKAFDQVTKPGGPLYNADEPTPFRTGFAEGFGTQPLGERAEQLLRDAGMFADPAKGEVGPIRFLNEAALRPVTAAADLVMRGGMGVLHGLAQAMPLVGGPLLASAEAFPGGHLTGFPVRPGVFSRPQVSPTGAVRDAPIGTMPVSEDFGGAAKVITGGGVPVKVETSAGPISRTEQKLLDLYTEKGLHPSEVAADAETDVVVSQHLASAGSDLPTRYVGENVSRETGEEAAPGMPSPDALPAIPSDIANGLAAFSPDELLVDANRFQFKTGGDESGVTERLQGIENWDPIKAGLVLVWEDANGQKYIVDGHQRLALAGRIAKADPAQNPLLNGILLREADGVSDIEARVAAAAKNIAEGTGTAVDAAKVLRDQPDLVRDLPPRSALVQQARGLSHLSDDAFRMVINDVVLPNYGAIVGRLAPVDEKLQGALMDLLAKTDPANAVQAESIVRQGIDAGLHTETQATLFGDQDVVSSLFLDRAKVLDRSLKTLARDRMVFQTIVREEDVLAAVGNRLETTENAKRAATDGQALQILQTLANRRGALSDALTAAARDARTNGNYAAASRDFVATIRQQAESGALTRLANGIERGRVDAGAEGAANLIDPAATRSRPAEERVAGERASELIQTEATEQGEQIVMPGMDRSGQQAMEAREAAGHGRISPEAPQAEPGGLFAEPAPEQPSLLRQLLENEEGALYFRRQPRPRPAPGSLEEARESILDKLSIDQPGPKRPWTWTRLYTNLFDKLYPINKAVSDATNGIVATSDNPYQLSRLLSGLSGKITGFLDGYDRQGNLIGGTRDWATGQVNGPSLRKVLEPVADDLNNFRAFAVAARGLELEARGITTGLDLAAMQTVTREGVGRFGPVLDELVDYQNRVAAYLRDSGVLSRDGYDAMVQANQLYVPFHRVIGDGDGVFRTAAGQSIQPGNPLHRILGSGRDIIDPIESIIRNTASFLTMAEKNEVTTALIDKILAPARQVGRPGRAPVSSVTLVPDPALDAALANYLSAHGVNAPGGLLGLLHAAAQQPTEIGTVRVFRNGTPHAYQIDPEIARAIKGLDSDTIGTIEKLLAPLASTLRAGAVLNPDFALRHTIRDYLYGVATARGFFSPLDMAKGFYSLVSKDQAFWNWMHSGGASISMVALDRRYLQEDIARLTQQTGIMTRALNVVADPHSTWLESAGALAGLPFKAASKYVIHPLQVLTELAENASHLGAFRKEIERMRAAGVTTFGREELQAAGFVSRDVAVDAARIGAKTRAYNMITAFANIALQDSDRVVRAFYNDPISTSFKVAGAITLPSALLWWANHDDPRYKELPEWQKDMFWIIPTDKWEDVGPAGQYGPPSAGTPYRVVDDRMQVNNGAIFRVPKPWGMGILFGSGMERALDRFMTNDPEAFHHWEHSIIHAAIPTMIPTALAPVFDQWTNRSSFTNRTLIPGTMEKQMPEYQYTPYTTETAKALGKIVGAFPGENGLLRNLALEGDHPYASGVARALTSPILIENYVRGWSGNLGNYTLQLADLGLRKSGLLPDPVTPTATLADIPVVRAFVSRYPSATTQSIQDFEDGYNKNKVFYDTWKAKVREGDLVAAERIFQAGGDRVFTQLDNIQKTLNEHNRLIRDVYKDPAMSASDKRQLIDTIYYRMIEVGQAGKAALHQVDTALSGARH